jgi:hypothetical protein
MTCASARTRRPDPATSFPNFLITMLTESRGEDAGTTEVTQDPARVSPIHHRQSSDVVFEHPTQGIAHGFVRIGDDQRTFAGFKHTGRATSVCLQSPHNVATPDDPHQLILLIYNQRSLPLFICLFVVMLHPE